MNHSLFARSKLNESTKVFNADNCSLKNLTFFKISYDDFDETECFVHCLFVRSANGNSTIIGNVDFNTGALNQCVDCLTSLTNNFTNLSRVNHNLFNLWSVSIYFFSRLCNCFCHNLIQDVKAGFSCSCNSLLHDFSCQTMNLNIHLDGSNTFFRTGNFKVHIAEEIFKTLNICQNQVIIIGITGYQTNGNTSNWCLNRNTGSHQ